MVEIIVPFIVFGSITAWVLGPKYLRLKHEERLKMLESGRGAESGTEVKLLLAERAQLEDRIRNLETIVCGVDLELNAKLDRVASRQLLLPAPAPGTNLGNAATVMAPAVLAQSTIVAGTKIGGRFVIEKALGTGGMGAVYLAQDEKLNERVALKLVRDAHIAEEAVLERFRREVSAARRINHPNVVRLYDMGEENGVMYLSMEYVAGDSLRDLMRRHRVLPLDQLRTLLGQLCDGLDAAHQAGVIHRDLKPENILLGPNQQAKIIDFGIAKINGLQGMTATSLILGTAEYMAPEQVRGREVDGRTDIYALGIVVYEALTGMPPFHGDSPIATGFAHCTEPLKPARQRKSDVPEAWDLFVQKALAKEASQRFDSATAMRRAIPT